jgi:hypothetical protein
MPPVYTRPEVGDVLLVEFEPRFNRDALTIKNNTGAAYDFKVGQTLLIGVAGDAGTYVPAPASAADAVLAKDIGEVANAASVVNTPCWVRGPLILNKNKLVHRAGSVEADILTSLKAKNILTVAEPVKQTATL